MEIKNLTKESWEKLVTDTFAKDIEESVFDSPKMVRTRTLRTIKIAANYTNKKEMKFYLQNNFSEKHIDQLIEFALLWQKIEDRELQQFDKESNNIQEDKEWVFNKGLNDEPEIYVEAYSDRLVAVASKPGLGDRLPSGFGRKYIGEVGKLQWRFNLGALPVFEKMNVYIFGKDNLK